MRTALQTVVQRPLLRSPAPAAGRRRSGPTLGGKTARSASLCVAAAGQHDFDGYEVCERRLRYPDGGERVLRYAGPACARNTGPRIDGERKGWWVFGTSSSTGEGTTAWLDAKDDLEEPTPSGRGEQRTAHERPAKEEATSAGTSSFPDSPAALLRMMNSDEFRAAREAREELVRKSYTVHRSNPYAERALLFILATYHEDKPADMFTMKTKVIREGAAEALGLPPGFAVQEITEGVLAFESEEDADRYAILLEAEGHPNIMIADTPSDALFELTTSCSAVVVLFKAGSQAPMPLELTQALKGAVSLE